MDNLFEWLNRNVAALIEHKNCDFFCIPIINHNYMELYTNTNLAHPAPE